jgi:hypothetical protein
LRYAAVLAALAFAWCAGTQPVRETATLNVVVVPDTASVFVDDHFAATARVFATRPVNFRPGVRHITITANGYFPHDVEVNLPAGNTTVRVELRPIPP